MHRRCVVRVTVLTVALLQAAKSLGENRYIACPDVAVSTHVLLTPYS
jgi:hypothetical protein